MKLSGLCNGERPVRERICISEVNYVGEYSDGISLVKLSRSEIAPITSVEYLILGNHVGVILLSLCVWFDPWGTTNDIRASGCQNHAHNTCFSFSQKKSAIFLHSSKTWSDSSILLVSSRQFRKCIISLRLTSGCLLVKIGIFWLKPNFPVCSMRGLL